MSETGIIVCFLSFLLGVVVTFFYLLQVSKNRKEYGKRIISDAKKEGERILKTAQLEAKEYLIKAKSDFEQEAKEKRREMQKWEDRLEFKEKGLDKRQALIEEKLEKLQKEAASLEEKKKIIERESKKIGQLSLEWRQKLQEIAGMTENEAKEIIIKNMQEKAKKEALNYIKNMEEKAKEEAKRRSQNIISLAIERMSGNFIAERTISTVSLPSDEMKGRIIGREGRNVRTFEKAAGVDLIIDDTPEVVVISSFNPLRRETARIALERLVADGRIHPARIEETIEKVREELSQEAIDEVKKIIFDLDIPDLHPEIIKHLSMLKFRTSYTQNVLIHSQEVAYLAGIMAAELGLDEKLARRAGLLHDIGKSVDQEIGGSHTKIGAEIAKKYGESEKVINAILSHHGEVEFSCPESVLVAAADALSAARPGARKEILEHYIKRLEELEKIALSHEGVKNAYAMQAGRELRVIVEEKSLSDTDSVMLAREIAQEIEEKTTYPGQVKVTVIRETRAIDYVR
ncbi:MAG: ribonuclease Y [Deltaproteobacteria bacterium]|nr:ribonuclease Y [Deltaproteobacteria bacterium]